MKVQKPTKPKGTKKKNEFVDAFTTCLRKRGYAKTSMADIAREAGCAPSHLFYYFESKEELLRVLFKQQCDVIVHGLENMEELDVEGKIDCIIDFLFTENNSVNTFTTGLMYEAIGISVNDPRLTKNKREMDESCKALLCNIFVGIEPNESTRNEKAEIIYALLAGVKLNGFFDANNGLAHGREMFRKAVRVFCGLDAQWSQNPANSS